MTIRTLTLLSLTCALVLSGCGKNEQPAAEGAKNPAPEKGVEPAVAQPEPEERAATANEQAADRPAAAVQAPAQAEEAVVPEKSLGERKRHELVASPNAPQPNEKVVAWRGATRIQAEEFAQYLRQVPAHQRREYSALEKKQELLRTMIKFEEMAARARAEGLEKDPRVQLALKTELVKTYLEKHYGEGAEVVVTDDEIEARYKEQERRYNKPERVRASHIFIKDEGGARKVLSELRTALAKGEGSTRQIFRSFVLKYSEDNGSKRRGGDLLFFTRDGQREGGQPVDPAVVRAAFAMVNMNQISDLVKGESGYHILLLTNRREKVDRPLEEVREELRTTLTHERRNAMRKEFMSNLVDFDEWHIESAVLNEVSVEAAPDSGDVKARLESIRSGSGKGAVAPKGSLPKVPAPVPVEVTQ